LIDWFELQAISNLRKREVIDLLGLRGFEEALQCKIIPISVTNLVDCLHCEQHITATANDDVTTGWEEDRIH